MSARLWVMPAAALLLAVCTAAAQSAPASTTTPPVDRGWLTINAGGFSGVPAFTDALQMPLNQETETIQARYPGGGGLIVSAAGGYTIWRHLSAGLGVSQMSRQGDASIDASLPHPLYDNQPRAISGSAGTTHHETTTDFKIGWMAQISPRVRLLLSGGPSIINVRQTIVTDVQYTESYPFDTARFSSAVTTEASHGIAGFNAAADLFWLFTPRVGIGGLVQVTHGTVELPVNGRTIPMDAGAVQGGGGIRFTF